MKKSKFSSRVYTPQLSAEVSASIRRLAWAINKPMTKTVSLVVSALPALIDSSRVCLACQDRSGCASCAFCHQATAEQKAALLANF